MSLPKSTLGSVDNGGKAIVNVLRQNREIEMAATTPMTAQFANKGVAAPVETAVLANSSAF